MTPPQLIRSCRERGIELFADGNGGLRVVAADGKAVTPKLLDTLSAHKIALLPYLPSPLEEIPNDLVKLGQEVEAGLSGLWDEALRAAQAGEMPSCDNTHPAFVPGMRPVPICRGTSTWLPAKTLLNADRLIRGMQDKYGEKWLKIDLNRPIGERDARSQVIAALAVVHWWSTYSGAKPEQPVPMDAFQVRASEEF